MRLFTRSSPYLRNSHPAQALIEFALIAPVMLLMVLGMVDLGRAFVYGVSAQEGARQAARLAATANYDVTVTEQAVLGRLVAASNPALTGCFGNPPVITTTTTSTTATSLSTCGSGTWTLTMSLSHGGPPYPTFAAARVANALAGATVTITSSGTVALFPGVNTGAYGLTLGQIAVQGNAAMVVL